MMMGLILPFSCLQSTDPDKLSPAGIVIGRNWRGIGCSGRARSPRRGRHTTNRDRCDLTPL
jgi:hypothetical protein